MINKSRDILIVVMGLLVGIICICSIADAVDLLVSWQPVTDEDAAGYNVSYDGPSSGRWSTPCSAYQVSSMGVAIGTTTYLITDAANGDYCVYVRTYDTYGNMSTYTSYCGNLSEGTTWTTVGVTEPTPCLPEAAIALSTSIGLQVNTLNVSATDESTGTGIDTWLWSVYNADGDQIADYTYSTQDINHTFGNGTSSLRLRVWNDVWFDDEWAYIYVYGIRTLTNGAIRNGTFHP